MLKLEQRGETGHLAIVLIDLSLLRAILIKSKSKIHSIFEFGFKD
jgi:hypothetical protein